MPDENVWKFDKLAHIKMIRWFFPSRFASVSLSRRENFSRASNINDIQHYYSVAGERKPKSKSIIFKKNVVDSGKLELLLLIYRRVCWMLLQFVSSEPSEWIKDEKEQNCCTTAKKVEIKEEKWKTILISSDSEEKPFKSTSSHRTDRTKLKLFLPRHLKIVFSLSFHPSDSKVLPPASHSFSQCLMWMLNCEQMETKTCGGQKKMRLHNRWMRTRIFSLMKSTHECHLWRLCESLKELSSSISHATFKIYVDSPLSKWTNQLVNSSTVKNEKLVCCSQKRIQQQKSLSQSSVVVNVLVLLPLPCCIIVRDFRTRTLSFVANKMGLSPFLP